MEQCPILTAVPQLTVDSSVTYYKTHFVRREHDTSVDFVLSCAVCKCYIYIVSQKKRGVELIAITSSTVDRF